MRQSPIDVMTTADMEASTAIQFVPVAAIKTGFNTHIGITQAQESEFPGGSYGMRRRVRAHKA